MDSTLLRSRAFARVLALGATGFILPAAALNHDRVVEPIAPGAFEVACSNVAQDASLIAAGASAQDYWEGRPVNGVDHYITEILANPQATLRFDAAVPDDRGLYPGHAGETVAFIAIVCHPTPRSNADASYTLPGTGEVIPHMQPPGAAPKLIGWGEYYQTLGLGTPPVPAGPAQLPFIVYSHGLTGSPISKGYVDVLVELAAHGFVVGAVFHGDPRFSRVRVQDFSDFVYLGTNFDRVAEMELMRPLSLKAMTDLVLSTPGFASGIDTTRIGGFGASLGGEAMTLLLGAQMTTSIGLRCSDPVHDPRVRAAVGYVPFAGYSFLPAFCDGQSGAASVNRPYLALSGTADTTAPIGMMEQAVDRFGASRYLVELVDGQHEFRPEDAGDLFTWMVTFLNAYLDVGTDPGAMGRLIRMNGVVGGRQDDLLVDVHIPFPDSGGEATVREFYNSIINHYFVTADGGEIDTILAGGAGAGWALTGEGFKAWPQIPADVAAAPACRFRARFRSRTISSFFTASAGECDIVKRDQGWRYVGTGFYILPVSADGTCPDGFLAVNRAYNDGFIHNDSNHRYNTSDSEMREMARKNWIVEGAVMCARP
jgi:predicted dienelactone hydrolase